MISWKDVQKLEKDDLLRLMGVEERRSGGDVLLSGLGWFAAGAAVGAVAALLWAPKSGSDVRRDLRFRMQGDGARSTGNERNDVRQTPGM